MHTYVSMYIYMYTYTCVHVYIYIRTHVHVHACIYICIYMCMCMNMHVYSYTCACACRCVHIYIDMCMCMCMCMHIYTYTWACACACVHVCVHQHMHVPAVVVGLLQISISFGFATRTLQEFQFSTMSPSFQSPLSHRVGRIVPTGNTAVDFTANQQRQALIDICEMSHSHPMHRVAARDFMRSLISNQSRATEIVQDNLFEKEVKTYNDLPLDFVLQWLLKATRLTSLDLGKIKCFDSAQLRQLLHYDQNVVGGCKLPEDCNSKEVATRLLDKRSKETDQKIKDLTIDTEQVSAEGKINWALLGPFDFKFNQREKLERIIMRHGVSSVDIVADEYNITRDFILANGHCPMKTALRKGSIRNSVISSCFCKDQGPHSVSNP